jgi:hypothetical protein
MNLKPCPFRQVDNDGRILCDKIKSGEREVSPNICRACPVSAINCAHLRATLDHRARPPITVRYGNGRTEIWDDVEPSIALERAACSAKITPITSARDCAGCALRAPMAAIDSRRQITHNRPMPQRAPRGALTPVATIAAPLSPQAANDEPRKSMVAAKIIQLQEWLAKQKAPPKEDNAEQENILPIAVGAGRVVMRARGDEKRVGWTD